MTDDSQNEIQAIEAAVQRLYDGIERATCGGGDEGIRDAWHHVPWVTTGHPNDGWAKGWEEVWVTWSLLASFGRADRGGSYMSDLSVRQLGDAAIATCVFHSSPTFGSVDLLCTNVLQRLDGEWRVIHHHVDKSDVVAAAFERLVREG